MKPIKWEDIGNSWRSAQAEIEGYKLVMTGLGKYQFGWALFYHFIEIAASDHNNPCRSSTEAKRAAEAAFKAATFFQPS